MLAPDPVLRYKERDRASEDNEGIPLFDEEKQQKSPYEGEYYLASG